MDGSNLEKTALAFGSTAAGMMLAVLRLVRTLVVTLLLSIGVLLLASADIHDAAELFVIGVAIALLLISVLILPANAPS